MKKQNLWIMLGLVALVVLMVVVFGGFNKKSELAISMYHWDLTIDRESKVYQEIREQVGIEINGMTAPWSEWSTKLNTMIASGEIPDIFVTYGPGDVDGFEKFAKDGLLLPLTPYIDEYPNIKKRLNGREDQMVEGEYYAIPVQHPKSDHVLMIRGDWLEDLNFSVPTTIDELYTVAKVFKEKYGIYPISSSPMHTSGFFWLNPIFYAFGGGWDTWIQKKDGSYVMCWVSEGNREGLRFLNRLYKEGLLDPEFVVNTDDMKMDKFLSGKAGIVFHNSIGSYSNQLKKINDSAWIEVLPPIEGPRGSGMWAMDGFFTAVSIHKGISEEKQRKVLELLDYLYSDEGVELLRYGVKSVHYDVKDGIHLPLLSNNEGTYQELKEVDSTASLRNFIELGGTWLPEWNINYALNLRAVTIGETYGQVPLFLYKRTEAQKKYGKQLTDLAFTEYSKLVQSTNFDTDWEMFVGKFYQYGGQEMTEAMNF